MLEEIAARRDEVGATSVEYGLLAVAIAAVLVVIVFALGGVVTSMFSHSCQQIQGQAATSATCP
jgi:pilus assembly protein Flp/PilA